tara:strand:- start:8460 stop:8882 length:423 start_codon:yes stop_codon:yes gene_type:complete
MAAGEFYKGKFLRLKFEGKTLFHATTCSLSIATDTDEIASKDTNGKIFDPGNYSGSLSTDCLLADKPDGSTTVVDAFDLMAFQLANTKLTWEFSNGVAGDRLISGETYLINSDFSAETNGIATGSFSFQTSGDIILGVSV